MEILLRSCTEVREPIELSFGMVSGVGPGIMYGMGVRVPQGEGAVSGVVFPIRLLVSVS